MAEPRAYAPRDFTALVRAVIHEDLGLCPAPPPYSKTLCDRFPALPGRKQLIADAVIEAPFGQSFPVSCCVLTRMASGLYMSSLLLRGWELEAYSFIAKTRSLMYCVRRRDYSRASFGKQANQFKHRRITKTLNERKATKTHDCTF